MLVLTNPEMKMAIPYHWSLDSWMSTLSPKDFEREYMGTFETQRGAGTLADNHIKISISSLDMMRDKSARAIGEASLLKSVEANTPNCIGCSNFVVSDTQDPMMDSLTITARCKRATCMQTAAKVDAHKLMRDDLVRAMQEPISTNTALGAIGHKKLRNDGRLDAQVYAMAAVEQEHLQPFYMPERPVSSPDTPESSPSDTW